uniref:Neur_chan_LBD domain-containing protein n=1 Tax=Angiostrongylus cantonensis TaxID=6313 RepID=A0A0K0D8Q6_ANGCA
LPTVSLNVYNVYLWDPDYIQKFQRRDLACVRLSLVSILYTPTPLPIQ